VFVFVENKKGCGQQPCCINKYFYIPALTNIQKNTGNAKTNI
jgi:hypothetical protein